MKQNSRFKLSALAVATAMACSPAAFATNGYFKHGYGQKAEGMGGVGVALPQDSLAPATNPAGLAFVGNRADVGVELFNPRRDATLDVDGPGGNVGTAKSGATLFLIPEAGFSMDMAGMTMGLSMVANGGMNTRYNSNIFDKAFYPNLNGPSPWTDDTGTLGVNLSQLLILPTVAYKLNDSHALGASMIIGYQRFRAYGLGDFQCFTASAACGPMGPTAPLSTSLTNRGDDDSWGAGLRLGWTGKLTDSVTVGATYASKVFSQPFEKYKELFAEQGDFDIPANFGVGIAFKPAQALTIAFDVSKILYSDVASIANPGPTPSELFFGPAPDRQLGKDGGIGFGWEDVTVYKLGVSYDLSDMWTLRGGINYGKTPIEDDQNVFNIVAPGVVEKHITMGFTYSPNKSNEITVAAMHALRKDQKYTSPYQADIGMSQNAVGASYAWKF